jgi:hypothetical protein
MSELDDLIRAGWARHEKEPEALGTDLEAAAEGLDAAGAKSLVTLGTHTIGEHLGDWERAQRLAEKALAEAADAPEWSDPLGNLAVAQFMAGAVVRGLASETRSASLAEQPLAALLRTRVLLASALVGSKRVAEGAQLYRSVLALAEGQSEPMASDRALAITSNNLASALVEQDTRSEEEQGLMLTAARAARTYWGRAGTWIHASRADYLLALVHNAREEFKQGASAAESGIAGIRDNGDEPVDEAFLHLALAGAARGLGNTQDYEAALARADELAAGFEGEGLKSWFKDERAKVGP